MEKEGSPPNVTAKGLGLLRIESFFEKVHGFMKELDMDLSTIVAIRDESGTVLASEYIPDDNSIPVCHRFNEVAGCNPHLIDAILSLKDCLCDVLDAAKGKDEV